MADDIVVNVAFKGNANDFLAELSRAVGRAKTQLQEMGQSTAALSRLETQLAKMSTTANQAAQATTRAAQATQGWSQRWTPFKGQFQAAEAASASLWKSIDGGFATADKSIGRATATLAKFDAQQAQTAKAQSHKNPMADWDKQFAALTVEADKNTKAMQAAKHAVDQYQNSLSNTRYVLYDVAGTLSILGIGLVSPLAAIVGVSVQMQSAFAQVERTSGATGEALQDLKADFDALYASIPITYDALAKIATLAGQLGVPADQIASFTDTVAKTATVTDLSVEQAATAFGRLNALIPNVQGQYERLGSAIAKVGVNSVATESEIVNISTQISSMGAFAGLTAQDIIGLSGALASIGAQPELSRGTVTRVFTLMSRAVANGGEALDSFASLSGVSAEKFRSSWGTPAFAQTFLGFMRGIKNEGGGAVAALNELGITSVRDVPLLLRLANAADSTGKAGALLAQTIGDANSGWSENIELQRQYAIIAETVASKFEVLINNFNLLLQAIGAPMLGALGDFLDFLTDIVAGATEFAQTDLGGTIFTVVVALTALLGVLAVAGGAMALMGASSIGLYQALGFLAVQSPITARMLLGTAGAAAIADGSLKAGAASALLFSRALRTITIVGALLILPEVINAAGAAMDDFLNKNQNVEGQLAMLGDKSSDVFLGLIRSVGGSRNVFTDIGNSLSGAGRAFTLLDDKLKSLVAGGAVQELSGLLNDIADTENLDAKETVQMFGEVITAAKEAGITIKVVGDEIEVTGKKGSAGKGANDEFGGSLDSIAADAEAATEALQRYQEELEAINGTVITAADASDRLQSSINAANEAIEAEGVTMDGTNDASITFRDSLREIEADARTAADAIIKNGGSVEEAKGKWQSGRDAVIALAERMGMGREEAIAWADTTLGKSAEVDGALAILKASWDAIPSSKNTSYTTTGVDAAIVSANNLRYAMQNIPSYKTITVTTNMPSGNLVRGFDRAFATGGPVRGPGSGTSDSIFARLSNGEYVLRQRAAAAIGYGRLNYMNQTGKLPGFAQGGPVNVNMPSTMMTELSPTDRSLISRRSESSGGHFTLSIADIARQVNAYNAKQARRGH